MSNPRDERDAQLERSRAKSPLFMDESNAILRQNHLYEMERKAGLDDVKKKLKEIFIYYASFGDRLNSNNLKSAKFHKMMQDSGIIRTKTVRSPTRNSTSRNAGSCSPSPRLQTEESQMNKKRIDLIFCSVNKHKVNMNFDTFLQALIKIAEFKYEERS